MENNIQRNNAQTTATQTPRPENSGNDAAAAAAAIRVIGDPAQEWATPGVFKQLLLFKASAILAAASLASGTFSILWENKFISIETKDFLVGIFYILTLGGALLLSGKLDNRKSALLIGNTIAFQAWNTLFFDSRPAGLIVVLLGLWLPVRWTLTDPATMEELGLGKKGLIINFLTGLVMAAALTAYLAWGMSNFGFTFKIEKWRLLINSAQVLPMYLSIFSLFFMVWNRLRSWGLSPSGMIVALTILTVSVSAPAFVCVAAATKTPPGTAMAGFTATSVIMILSTHLTFGKFRSIIPVACLFTALAALLIMTGLS